MSAEPPAQTAVVDLARVGVPRLLFELLRRRFTGTAIVMPTSPVAEPCTMVVRGGMPVALDSAERGTRLGELLVEEGVVRAEKVDAALARAGGRRLGEILREEGVSGDAVLLALREQCERRVLALFACSEGEAQLIAGAPEQDEGLYQARTLAVLARGVQRHWNPQRIAAQMGSALGGGFSPSESLEAYRDRFELSEAYQGALDWIAGTDEFRIDELVSAAGIDRTRAVQMIFLLWTCEMLTATAAVAEEPSGPLDVEGAEALVDRVETLLRAGAEPLEILGLTDGDPSLAEIDAAVARLSRRLAPDGMPPDAPDALRTRALQLRAALADVRAMARDRREALAEMQATRLVKEGKLARALPLLEDVAAVRPDHGPTLASLAWCRFQVSDKAPDRSREAIEALNAVVGAEPGLAVAHYFRGMVLLGAGDKGRAATAFARVLELDPEHVDAQRQLRILRSGQPQPAPRPSAKEPEFKPRGKRRPRGRFWSGAWPAIWIVSGLLLVGMIAAQIVLRMDVDF